MSGLSRREFLGQSLTALSGAVVLGGGRGAVAEPVLGAAGPVAPGQHRLPPLPYAPGALRGLSEQMVTWHHDRHFAGYINGRNAVATALAALDPTARDFDSKAYKGLKKQEAVHACGAALHTVYFDILGGDGTPGRQDVVAALRRDFGSLARWRADLSAAAHAAGIGWGLTCWDPACRRLINFAVEAHQLGAVWGAVPLIPLDVWEHAYYHDYGPDKARYFDAFFANLHWDRITARFRAAGGA